MNKGLNIAEFLRENFSAECEAVGSTNLEDIIDGQIDFVPAEHGSYMDIGLAIATLVAATTIIKNTLDIYNGIKRAVEGETDDEELALRAAINPAIFNKLNKNDQEKLIRGIIRKLKKKNR